jgi:thiamine-phosphate pyrophosphorylase
MRSLTELAGSLKLRLVLMTDADRRPDPLPLAARLPAGSWVVLRHYGRPGRAELAARLARLCRARRLTLLVAGDFALARALSAGLHLPEAMAAGPAARLRLWHRRRRRPLTVAAHGRRALVRAAALGADAALLAPLFATASHPGRAALGLLAFRRLATVAKVPVYALGGVTGRTILALRGSAAAGVATVGGIA